MEFVDLHAQYLSIREEIDAAIATVVRESSFIRGPHVDEFERSYARLLGARHCVSCANGTDAIYIALRALDLKHGEEVITTAHSWISTAETITQAGGRVVFCDTEPDYHCLDPQQIERLITPRTRGIIAVHLYGQPADMDPIAEIAKRYGLWVVEDCAQAHLGRYKGRIVGTIGDVGCFSFYPSKNLGAMGDAGCIVTNRDDIAGFSTLFARSGGKGQHLMEGINSRLDGLQAAVLNVKLKRLPDWTRARQRIATLYDGLLSASPGIITPPRRPGAEHVYHLYVIRSERRSELKTFLAAKNIPTMINYPKALPFFPAYSYLCHKPDDFPVAFRDQEEILSIPIYPEMPDESVAEVADAIREFAATRSVAAVT